MAGEFAVFGPLHDGARSYLQVRGGLRCCEPFSHNCCKVRRWMDRKRAASAGPAGLSWGGSSDHTGDSIEAARLRSQALRDVAANGMFPRLVVRCSNNIDINVPSSGFRSGSNPLLWHTGVVLWSFLWTNLSLGDLRPPIFGHRSAVTRKALRLACALSALQRFN